MVECTALEMRHTGNRIGGSNPSLSASQAEIVWEFSIISILPIMQNPQSPRRFPPPWSIAIIRQALAADAPRAFHRRCSSVIGARNLAVVLFFARMPVTAVTSLPISCIRR